MRLILQPVIGRWWFYIRLWPRPFVRLHSPDDVERITEEATAIANSDMTLQEKIEAYKRIKA